MSANAPELPSNTVAEPTEAVGRLFLVLFGFLTFGFYLTVLMPGLFSLPYKMQQLDHASKALYLGVAAGVGALISIIAGPAAGVLSDRTHSRWGRRRPWMAAGLVIGTAGSVVVATAPNFALATLGWSIACLGNAGVGAGITPIMAERVPERQRGLVGAIYGVATQLAGVLGYTLGGPLTSSLVLLFAVPYIVLAIGVVMWMQAVPDPAVELPRTSVSATFRLMVFNPREQRDFGLLWLGKFCMQVALAFLSTYQLYFLSDRLGFTAQEAGQKLALAGGIGIIVTMSFAIFSGIWSDRLKRRKVFITTSSVLTVVGLLLLSITHGFGLFLGAVMFILGAAGMFGSVDTATASDLVPDKTEAGRWMTIYGIAAALPTAVAPALGSLLLMIGSSGGTNYTALFIAGALFAGGTIATTYGIRGVR